MALCWLVMTHPQFGEMVMGGPWVAPASVAIREAGERGRRCFPLGVFRVHTGTAEGYRREMALRLARNDNGTKRTRRTKGDPRR